MDLPALKLEFVKGPRSGETLEFKPGSRVRVGRVVRGNDVAIKDPGVSSKHLCIESVSGKWEVRDLGSSNGTILNSTSLSPDTRFDLRDGDCIRLGEQSSVVVNLIEVVHDVNAEVGNDKLPTRATRNSKRNQDPDALQPIMISRTRRGRATKQTQENKILLGGSVKSSVSRAPIVGDNAEEDENLKRDRRGDPSVSESQNVGGLPKSCVLSGNPSAQECRRGGRALRNRVVGDDTKLPGALAEKADARVSCRVTRQRKKEIEEILALDSEKIEMETGKKRGARSKVRKAPTEDAKLGQFEGEKTNLREEDPVGSEVNNKDTGLETVREDTQNCSTVLDNGQAHGQKDSTGLVRSSNEIKVERVSYCELTEYHYGAESGVCTSDKEDLGSGLEIDLERMTLGEWFDYMEAQLPKQIIDETEKMIDAMKSKALQVHKYIKAQKGKVPVG